MVDRGEVRVRERALRLGRSAPLSGILCEPEKRQAGEIGVIILNSGVMHRVGTCRLSVKIARAAARAGFPALRMDFSGIGDSEPRRDSLSFMESAPREAQEAMDHLLETRGLGSFVLMGLCSGGDMSYYTALIDPRVVGVMQIDAYLYKPWRHYVHYYLPRMRRPSAWLGFAQRSGAALIEALRRGSRGGAALPEDVELPSYVRVTPPRREIAAGLSRLVERGVHLYYIYTGIWGYTYPTQFHDAFRSVDFRDRLRVDWLRSADHIVTGIDEQVEVVRGIEGWLCSTFLRRPRPEAARQGADLRAQRTRGAEPPD